MTLKVNLCKSTFSHYFLRVELKSVYWNVRYFDNTTNKHTKTKTWSAFCVRQQATTQVCVSHRCRRTCRPCWCRCEARGWAWCRWHHRCPSQRPTWRLFALPDRVRLSQMDETETHRQFPSQTDKDSLKQSSLNSLWDMSQQNDTFFPFYYSKCDAWEEAYHRHRKKILSLTKAGQNDSQLCFSELRNAVVLLLGCLKELCLTCFSPTAGGQFWHGLKTC